MKYAIRIPANDSLERDIAELLTRPASSRASTLLPPRSRLLQPLPCIRSWFPSKYFGLRSQPIFEIVTVFRAPFLEKPIRTECELAARSIRVSLLRVWR